MDKSIHEKIERLKNESENFVCKKMKKTLADKLKDALKQQL